MRIELAQAAVRDFKRIPKSQKVGIRRTFKGLEGEPFKAIKGRPPWRRTRSGQTRILYREIDGVLLGARIIQRKDLERAIKGL